MDSKESNIYKADLSSCGYPKDVKHRNTANHDPLNQSSAISVHFLLLFDDRYFLILKCFPAEVFQSLLSASHWPLPI